MLQAANTFNSSTIVDDMTTATTTTTRTEVVLPPLPCPRLDSDHDGTRFLREKLPVSFQNFVRDSGLGRWLMDTLVILGIPAILEIYPDALDSYLALSDAPLWIRNLVSKNATQSTRTNSLERIRYGTHDMQLVDLMKPIDTKTKRQERLVVFVHGGAWGSGRPWMYRPVAQPFLDIVGSDVAIVGYRTWPDANVQGQVDDVQNAVQTILQKQHYKEVILVGHSSGAHISKMLLLSKSKQEHCIDKFVGLVGVYCIPTHYEYESGRGVEELSALKPACGYTVENWKRNSPTQLVVEATRTHSLPPMLLIHGGLDTVVPYSSTLELARKLSFPDCTSLILPSVDHAQTVIEVMYGGETRNVVMDWLSGSDM